MFNFILGAFVGAVVMLIVLPLLYVNRDKDRDDKNEQNYKR